MTKHRHTMAVAAHLLLENQDGQILFLRRANTGYADGQWSIPAGHVDGGETLVEACIRETAEELDVRLDEADLRELLVQHKRDTDGEERLDIFFRATLPHGQMPIIAEPEKCDALAWALTSHPPRPLVPYVGAALEAILYGEYFVNYFGFSRKH